MCFLMKSRKSNQKQWLKNIALKLSSVLMCSLLPTLSCFPKIGKVFFRTNAPLCDQSRAHVNGEVLQQNMKLNTEVQLNTPHGTVNVSVSSVSMVQGCIKYVWHIWGLVSFQAHSPSAHNTSLSTLCLKCCQMLSFNCWQQFGIQAIARECKELLLFRDSDELYQHARNVVLCSGVFSQIMLHKYSEHGTAKSPSFKNKETNKKPKTKPKTK